ncbi:biofilm development regulator YmgB/AriR family protein [Enterobacter mori]
MLLPTPQTTDLLAAIMQEFVQHGQPAANKAIIASVLSRLGGEFERSMLQAIEICWPGS